MILRGAEPELGNIAATVQFQLELAPLCDSTMFIILCFRFPASLELRVAYQQQLPKSICRMLDAMKKRMKLLRSWETSKQFLEISLLIKNKTVQSF